MEIIFVVNTEAGNLQVLIIEWAGAGRGDEKLGQFVFRDCNNKLITILSTVTYFRTSTRTQPRTNLMHLEFYIVQ